MTEPSEAFPILSTVPLGLGQSHTDNNASRARRGTSGLGGEIRAGDTGAPAIATLPHRPNSFQHQHDNDRRKPFSKRRKAKTLFQQLKRVAWRYTWLMPLVFLLIVLGLYAINPNESNVLHRFIFLSYKIPIPAGAPLDTPYQYGKGARDFAFITFYVVVLSFIREFIIQNFLRPLARRSVLKSRAKQSRFMEQMYTAIYFGVLGPYGLYCMSRTPVWYFSAQGMYAEYPHKTHEASIKAYYLLGAVYWTQQVIVLMLGMERPRKDFKELVGHHNVTLILIALSYYFHFTYLGLAVYITHDISDFFLATSKVMNYIDHPLVGPYFGCFIGIWVYLRHYVNLRIIWSLFYEFKTVGPYGVDWDTEQYKGDLAFGITLGLLASLQALNLFWLYCILRIAYRFVFLNVLEDVRSDDDEDEFRSEQTLDAACKQGDEKDGEVNNSKMLLIDGPLDSKSTAADVYKDGGVARAKERVRK